jgi:hypothetical protein
MPMQRPHHRDMRHHRITAVFADRYQTPRLSIAGSGQRNPQLLSSKRPVNCALDFGDRILLVFGLAHLNYFRLAQRHRPFPDAALNALNYGIFYASIFHR